MQTCWEQPVTRSWRRFWPSAFPLTQQMPSCWAKYLKQIVVKVIHLHEFQPSKTKVEKNDIESVVGEFRQFLEAAVDGDGKAQSTILEIK